MNRRLALTLAALAWSCSSCSDDKTKGAAPRDQQADLGGEVIARISASSASDAVPKSVVAKVAAEQRITPEEAARRLVDDAIAAVAARERGLDTRPPTSWHLRSARARFAIDRLRTQSRAAGPPTDSEIEEVTAKYWRAVDRPESARVVHVVVMRSKPEDAALDARAKTFAAELRSALVDAKTTEEFSEKAKAFPHPKELKVQVDPPLPAVTEDGYAVDGPGTFDVAFSKAANALAKPGDTSPVVQSQYGWHVIRLIEKLPAQRMPLDERRIAFTEEAYSFRAKKAYDALLGPIRAAHPVTIEPSAEALMRSVMTTSEAK